MSTPVVRGLIQIAEGAGVPRAALLDAGGIDPEQLEDMEARWPRQLMYRLCDLAVELSGNPALGLYWGERHDGYTFDVTGHLVAHSDTLRVALESLVEFQRLLTDEAGHELTEHEDAVTIRCIPVRGETLRVERFVAETTVTGFWKLLRAFCGDARAPSVSFSYEAPTYREEYARVFEGSEQFGQPFTGLVFDRKHMDAPAPHRDPDMYGALRTVAERRLLRMTRRTPYALRVRDHLVKQGPAARVDMESVARSLGLSGRSLRRRLAAEGETYDAVANEALAIMAKHLLATSPLTIQETAHTLGFAHASTFHRAFKRLTGMTPLAYRFEQLRGEKRD